MYKKMIAVPRQEVVIYIAGGVYSRSTDETYRHNLSYRACMAIILLLAAIWTYYAIKGFTDLAHQSQSKN